MWRWIFYAPNSSKSFICFRLWYTICNWTNVSYWAPLMTRMRYVVWLLPIRKIIWILLITYSQPQLDKTKSVKWNRMVFFFLNRPVCFNSGPPWRSLELWWERIKQQIAVYEKFKHLILRSQWFQCMAFVGCNAYLCTISQVFIVESNGFCLILFQSTSNCSSALGKSITFENIWKEALL